jgi:hypothetical protein
MCRDRVGEVAPCAAALLLSLTAFVCTQHYAAVRPREMYASACLTASAKMWEPETEEWTRLAQMDAPHTNHSVALLLPDGRIFSDGGGLC